MFHSMIWLKKIGIEMSFVKTILGYNILSQSKVYKNSISITNLLINSLKSSINLFFRQRRLPYSRCLHWLLIVNHSTFFQLFLIQIESFRRPFVFLTIIGFLKNNRSILAIINFNPKYLCRVIKMFISPLQAVALFA